MIHQLSERKNHIIEELTKGYTVKEIASRNYISPHTVDAHLKESKRKTGAKTLAHLASMFVKTLL
ncbi:hypothetical protein MHTCC0001_15970 [Flavobacteriaceae bacterium MHTCC 0001]